MAKVYNPIPGIGSGRGRLQVLIRSRIYSGPDHLLIVLSTGYTEEYKRIFYRDIRYIDVRKNRGQLWQTIISGVIFLLLLLIFYLANAPTLVAVICSLPIVIWILVNLFRGPTCDCYISTNVQTLKLPVPGRARKVTKLISFLRTQTAAFESAEMTQPVA